MSPATADAHDATELVTLNIADIIVRPQVRTAFGPEEIQALAGSIRAIGLQQPLMCASIDEGHLLIDGERRLKALDLLGETEALVLVIADPGDTARCLGRQLAANMAREDLNPMDRARGLGALIDQTGVTGKDAAQLVGISAPSVSKSLRLLDLPTNLQDLVASGAIGADIGYRLATLPPEERDKLADEVLGNRLTRDALDRKRGRFRRAEETRRGTRVTATLAAGKTVTFVGSDLSLDTVTDWLEQLLSKARKAKQQGITLTTFVSTLRDQAKATDKPNDTKPKRAKTAQPGRSGAAS